MTIFGSVPMPPPVSLEVANEARRAAREARAVALLRVRNGDMTPLDVINAAATEEGRPLMKLSIYQLLIAQEGWGDKKAKEAIRRIFEVLEMKQSDATSLKVGWVIDPRSGGRRFLAWVDVIEIRSRKVQPPWMGFPFTQSPASRNKGK